MSSFMETLDQHTREGVLYEKLDGGALRCFACGHRCVLPEGKRGICKVRFNRGGRLRVPWGYAAGLAADPVEKKPFFHVLPGSIAMTFGMLGCDFHCQFCQNWLSSQILRDPACDLSMRRLHEITPEEIAAYARQSRAGVIASSYNEPLITAEWAAAIFEPARRENLLCAFVSNGNITPETLAYLRPYLGAIKIDLKTMQDKQYRSLGGVLQNVLDGIRMAYESGLWVEVVTLVIPGFNDAPAELFEAARYIASVSPDIPWHVTAFHPDYKMTNRKSTSPAALTQAVEIGEEAGLRYVYAGNLPGRSGKYEDTRCPQCQKTLVERTGFSLHTYAVDADGKCPSCGTAIPGIWHQNPGDALLEGSGRPRHLV